MKKVFLMISVILLLTVLAGCSAHIHTIGDGAQGNDLMEKRQWYALWGLVPLNEVDSQEMVGSAENYEIKTETSALDVLINIFTAEVSIVSRTVTVTK